MTNLDNNNDKICDLFKCHDNISPKIKEPRNKIEEADSQVIEMNF